MGGKRKPKANYHVWVDYSLGWSENRESLSSLCGHATEAEAIQSAIEQIDEMRRRGADSPVRLIRVVYWEGGGSSLADAPVLHESSYYDPEQKLTDAEVYAARAHEWHALPDRSNRHAAARNSEYFVGYSNWTEEWGPKPTICPACNRVLNPQNMY